MLQITNSRPWISKTLRLSLVTWLYHCWLGIGKSIQLVRILFYQSPYVSFNTFVELSKPKIGHKNGSVFIRSWPKQSRTRPRTFKVCKTSHRIPWKWCDNINQNLKPGFMVSNLKTRVSTKHLTWKP